MPRRGAWSIARRLDLYVAGRILIPLLATIAVTILLLVLQYLPILFQRTVQSGGNSWTVWKMLGCLVPEYLNLGLPIGLLLGTLLAFRKLALEHELDAITSCGIGPLRLLRVPLVYAALISALTLWTAGFVQPLSIYRYDSLGFQLKVGAFGIPIKVGEFNQLSDNITLRLEELDEPGGKMTNVFVHVSDSDGSQTAFSAHGGQFERSSRKEMLVLHLTNGRVVHVGKGFSEHSALNFDHYDLAIRMPQPGSFRVRGGREEEMVLPELFDERQDAGLSPQQRRLADGEAQRRIILMLLPFLLPFLALSLAKPPSRTSSSVGVVVGAILIILMLKSLDIGVKATAFPAAPMLWGSFAAFAALTARLFALHAGRPDADPLDWLHQLTQRALDTLHISNATP